MEANPAEFYDAWLNAQIEKGVARRKARIEALKTADDVLAWAKDLKAWFRKTTGPLIPLREQRAESCGQIEAEHYAIEKWLIEVFPGTFSSANLYAPRAPNSEGVAVLACLGHWAEGKTETDYQNLGAFFASHGVPVLIYEHAGNGERREYWDPIQNVSMPGKTPTAEHSRIGDLSVLAGIPVVRFFVTEAIRAREFLARLDYVDKNKIGMTGASGGGSLTRSTVCYDDDFAFGVPVCIIRSPSVYGGSCPEQINWDSALRGVSAIDQLISNAPRPAMVVVEHIDRGAKESFADLKRLYEIMEAPESRAAFFQVDDVHGYTHPMIEAVYRFVARNFDLPPLDASHWMSIKIRPPKELWTCPSGFINRDRPQVSMQEQVKRQLDEPRGITARNLKAILQIDETRGFNVPAKVEGMIRPSMKVTGSLAAREGEVGLMEWSEHDASYFHNQGFLYKSEEASRARGLLCLDLNLVGLRALQILHFLEAHKGKVRHLEAEGKWSIPLVFAAALSSSDMLESATARKLLRSYRECFDADLNIVPMGSVVNGIMRFGDLDDLVKLVGPRLTVESRTDPYGRVVKGT